jgi:SH3 domain protein
MKWHEENVQVVQPNFIRRLAMRFRIVFITLILLISSMPPLPAAADTRYVGDELVITLRQGKGTDYKIIRTLKSGTPFEVLEEGKSYLKVRTEDGVEGYVLRQYVTSDLPKSLRIDELEKLNTSLQEKISVLEDARNNLEMQLKTREDAYQQELSELQAKYAESEQNLEQTRSSEQAVTEKYDTLLAQSGNVVEIAAEREQLLLLNKRLEADAAAYKEENEKLSNSRMIKWFLAGGGVFFFGWIIGKVSRKKRSRL